MSLLLHPLIVHFPLALAFLLPPMALIISYFTRRGSFSASTWWLVAGLQLFSTATGYLAMQTGEQEEHIVARVTGKPPIEEHEERAEMFVAGSVTATALSIIAPFVKLGVRPFVQLFTVLILVGNAWLAQRTGEAGGELVYKYGAPNAYIAAQTAAPGQKAELMPTPDKTTSESAMPAEDVNPDVKPHDPEDEDEDEEPEAPTSR